MRNIVKARIYSENDRQRVVTDLNGVISKLNPQREVINRVNVRFVPVRYNRGDAFIPGSFVVKIRVASGHPQHTYFYEEGLEGDRTFYSYYRDEKSVRRIDEDDFWQLQSSRFLFPVDRQINVHEGQCS